MRKLFILLAVFIIGLVVGSDKNELINTTWADVPSTSTDTSSGGSSPDSGGDSGDPGCCASGGDSSGGDPL